MRTMKRGKPQTGMEKWERRNIYTDTERGWRRKKSTEEANGIDTENERGRKTTMERERSRGRERVRERLWKAERWKGKEGGRWKAIVDTGREGEADIVGARQTGVGLQAVGGARLPDVKIGGGAKQNAPCPRCCNAVVADKSLAHRWRTSDKSLLCRCHVAVMISPLCHCPLAAHSCICVAGRGRLPAGWAGGAATNSRRAAMPPRSTHWARMGRRLGRRGR